MHTSTSAEIGYKTLQQYMCSFRRQSPSSVECCTLAIVITQQAGYRLYHHSNPQNLQMTPYRTDGTAALWFLVIPTYMLKL